MIAIAAIVLAALIWTQHRSEADELRYRTGAMQAAADWTSVLINMNTDTVEASLAQLHEGTVGQLNADFDAAVRPYRDLVQKLQSRTTGQVDSVAVEFVHHEQPGRRAAEAAAELRYVPVRLPHRHRAGRGHVNQRERRQRQAADGALDAAARRFRCRRQADDLPAGADPMRNILRILAFDVAPPLAAIAALVYIGIALAWPLWWVSVFSVLCLLIVQAVVVNVVLARRDGVTVGTDDDGPRLRLAVAATATATLAAAVVVGYLNWSVPDRNLNNATAEVVGIATSVSEASATFTPQSPTASIDRATSLMSPQSAEEFKKEFASVAKDLASRNITAQASTISAGVEAIGPAAASVAVVLHGTQNSPGNPPDTAVLALRVQLSKQDGRWLVDDVSPIHSR